MLPYFLARLWILFSDYVKTFLKPKNDELIYFDFETTGLNPYHDKIIEYSFIVPSKCPEDYYCNKYNLTSLVDPETKFSKKITDITGIHPDMLEGKENITVHIDKIFRFISNMFYIPFWTEKNIYLVAHNATTFDKTFLMRELNNYKNTTDKYVHTDNLYFIDTLLLSRKLFPELYSYSLKSLCEKFNIIPGTHRAIDDTIALKAVTEIMVDVLTTKIPYSKQYMLQNPKIIYDYINTY